MSAKHKARTEGRRTVSDTIGVALVGIALIAGGIWAWVNQSRNPEAGDSNSIGCLLIVLGVLALTLLDA